MGPVGTPERPLEPGELDVWVGHEQFVSLLDAAAERDDVTLTFDDGNASDLEQALPALRERGCEPPSSSSPVGWARLASWMRTESARWQTPAWLSAAMACATVRGGG